MPARHDPERTFCTLLFCLTNCIFTYYVTPLLKPYFALCNTPRVTRQFGRWPQRTRHGTNTYELCIRDM